MTLTAVDPEVAKVAFARDLTRLWSSGRPDGLGWQRTDLDSLTTVVQMPGRLQGGERHDYYVRLDGSYYDAHPPRVTFVAPDAWTEAAGGSRWLPTIEAPPPWFALHPTYDYPDGTRRQLVCFSHNLDYYLSSHSPQPTEIWVQGRHTLAAPLSRVHEMLGPPYYRGPSSGLLEQAA